MVYKLTEELKKQRFKEILDLMDLRGHTFLEGEYKTKQSTLFVLCEKHEFTHETTFNNYKRSRTGCPCCGDEQKSVKLKNREFSEETIEKMRFASQRPRGESTQNERRSFASSQWRRLCLSNFKHQCAITGTSVNEGKVVVHHLHCFHGMKKVVWHPLNGLPLLEEFHVLFHNKFGYRNSTLGQFSQFLDFLIQNSHTINSMPTSSRSCLNYQVGSETRAIFFDVNNIKKLQERLKEADKTLTEILQSSR